MPLQRHMFCGPDAFVVLLRGFDELAQGLLVFIMLTVCYKEHLYLTQHSDNPKFTVTYTNTFKLTPWL